MAQLFERAELYINLKPVAWDFRNGVENIDWFIDIVVAW